MVKRRRRLHAERGGALGLLRDRPLRAQLAAQADLGQGGAEAFRGAAHQKSEAMTEMRSRRMTEPNEPKPRKLEPILEVELVEQPLAEPQEEPRYLTLHGRDGVVRRVQLGRGGEADP